MNRFQRALPIIVLCCLVLIYSATLQVIINGDDSGYTLDTGELQVALNLWGTIHFTGYPLYTILSSVITVAVRSLGTNPAAAASVSSLVWQVASLATMYAVLMHLSKGKRSVSLATTLLFGLVETIWIHAVIAEVYGFSLLCFLIALLLTLQLQQEWSYKQWLLLVVVFGIGGSHHRLLALVTPGLLLIILPQLWQNVLLKPRRVVTSFAVGLLPFLSYLYLPFRALDSEAWVYGRPDSIAGFWEQFTGSEATGYVLIAPQSMADWQRNAGLVTAELTQQLPWPLLLLACLGLLLMLRKAPVIGSGMLLAMAGSLLFVLIYPLGVLLEAALISAIAIFVLGWGYLTAQIAQMGQYGAWAGPIASLLIAGWLFNTNLTTVQAVTQNRNGVETIATLARLHDSNPAKTRTLALPWGGDFFAAAYGTHVTQELSGFALVDHRADLAGIIRRDGQLLTLDYNLGTWSYDWWREQLGTAHLGMAAPGVTLISQNQLSNTDDPLLSFELGNSIRVRSAAVKKIADTAYQLSIHWEALKVPEFNYSVAVHLLSQNPPQSPDDLLAQADAAHPVGGWYPTLLWQRGELVRDEYLLEQDGEGVPQAIRLTMYRQDVDGNFINGEWYVIPLAASSD